VTAVTLHDVTTATWDDGFSGVGGDCSEGSATVPPKCHAMNGSTVPIGFEQYVILKLEASPATEYAGFVWVSPTATVVAPGATEILHVAGLPTWWKTTYQGWGTWSSGGARAGAWPPINRASEQPFSSPRRRIALTTLPGADGGEGPATG
jgi:hypothetical protein